MNRIILFVALMFCAGVVASQNEQAVVTLKNGTSLKGKMVKLDPTVGLTIEIAGFPTEIKMSDVEQIESGELEPVPAEAPTTSALDVVEEAPSINEGDIHGCLIAEGNCVFIPTDSPYDFEQAGQERLKQYVRQWGYWKVVARPEQAHFVLQYTTQLSGEDFSFLIVRPRKYYAAHPTLVRSGFTGSWTNAKGEVGVTVNYLKGNEDVSDNVRNAELLAEHFRRMITQPDNKDGKRFFKYHSDALNADNKSNNSSSRVIYAQ